MLVSWNWLKQYVPLDMPLEEFERRLMMAGLNHEGTAEVAGDLAIDLGSHEQPARLPGPHRHRPRGGRVVEQHVDVARRRPAEGKTPVEKLVKVRIECPDLCLRYTARVIRGVKIAPSPLWMVRRLKTVGITPINNVVDISNYVLMECGQPLHTFDFGKLRRRREIVVRRPLPGETIEAIDHKTYELGAGDVHDLRRQGSRWPSAA